MKKTFLSLLLIFSIIELKAQKFDISIQANGGLSHFSGASTVNTTFLDAANPTNHSGYPNGDGNKPTFSYGADLQWQYTFKSNFILGLQTGYEVTGSKTDINGVYDYNGFESLYHETPATGYFTYHYHYINLNPYIGYRFNLNTVKLDVLPGFDEAFGLNTTESVDIKASDKTYYNRGSLSYKPSSEFRLRLGVAAYYKEFGITGSFSRSKNYSEPLADTYVPPIHMEVFRLGLSYRIM